MIIPAKLAFAAGSVATATVTVIAQEVVAPKLSLLELIPVFVSAAVIVIPLLGAAAVAIINAVKRQGDKTQQAMTLMEKVFVAKQDEVKTTLVEKQEEVKTAIVEKQEEIKAEGKVTGGHVNSLATAAQGREDGLRKENALLREMLAAKTLDQALLAQAAASKAPVVVMAGAAPTAAAPIAVPPVAVASEPRVTLAAEPIGSSAEASLKKIEIHTKETAVNTAKTERDVADLKDKA